VKAEEGELNCAETTTGSIAGSTDDENDAVVDEPHEAATGYLPTGGVGPVVAMPCPRCAQAEGVLCVEPAGTSIVTVIVSGSSRRWVAHFWR
jgi:hypothetical protein